MRTLSRPPEPAILAKNKAKWTKVYLKKRRESPTSRPPSSQYRHAEIRDTLAAMSFRKCFYCERKLADSEGEVDHVVEVVERPDLAFEWENLCWACRECNRKKQPNARIPLADCLDPCGKIDLPEEHLSFEDEYIRPRYGSGKGSQTIRKYHLDRDQLNYLRVKQLREFDRLLRTIRERQLHEERREITKQEREFLLSFGQPARAFSLMFQIYLGELGW